MCRCSCSPAGARTVGCGWCRRRVRGAPTGPMYWCVMAAVLGEVPDRDACIRGLERVLNPGALLVFVEAFPDPDRQSVAALRELVEPRGFVLQCWEGTTWRDVVQFRRIPTL